MSAAVPDLTAPGATMPDAAASNAATHGTAPPRDSGAAVLAFAFQARSLVTELNAALTALFRPLGLSCVQAEALLALDTLGPVGLSRLAEHLVAESGHPSRLVSRLVAAGLVVREPSDADGRAVVLTLTPRGSELAEQARKAREPLLREFGERWGAELGEAAELITMLREQLTSR